MELRHKYDNLVFAYYYLLVSNVLISIAFVSGGLFREMIFLVLIAVIGYFWMNFRWAHRKKREAEKKRDWRCHALSAGFVVFICWFVLASMDGEAAQGSTWKWTYVLGACILGVLLLAMFVIYAYADYFRTKYLTMYTNSHVTKDTIKRFEKNTFHALRRRYIAGGIVALALIALAINLGTIEVNYTPQEENKNITEVEDNAEESVVSNKVRQHQKKEKKERSTWWEMVLKVLLLVFKVVIIILFVLAIVIALYLICRKLLGLQLPEYQTINEKSEAMVEGMDEYIPLKPRNRRREDFAADSNGRIRRHFYHKVKKRASGNVDTSLTPWELAKTYLPREGESLSAAQKEAISLYEKARYSGEMCSAEDVERMREKL